MKEVNHFERLTNTVENNANKIYYFWQKKIKIIFKINTTEMRQIF